MPITEYYAGSRPLLCFDEAEALVRDVAYLARTGTARFSPLLVTSDERHIEEVRELLEREGILSGEQPLRYNVAGRTVIDMTRAIDWGTPE